MSEQASNPGPHPNSSSAAASASPGNGPTVQVAIPFSSEGEQRDWDAIIGTPPAADTQPSIVPAAEPRTSLFSSATSRLSGAASPAGSPLFGAVPPAILPPSSPNTQDPLLALDSSAIKQPAADNDSEVDPMDFLSGGLGGPSEPKFAPPKFDFSSIELPPYDPTMTPLDRLRENKPALVLHLDGNAGGTPSNSSHMVLAESSKLLLRCTDVRTLQLWSFPEFKKIWSKSEEELLGFKPLVDENAGFREYHSHHEYVLSEDGMLAILVQERHEEGKWKRVVVQEAVTGEGRIQVNVGPKRDSEMRFPGRAMINVDRNHLAVLMRRTSSYEEEGQSLKIWRMDGEGDCWEVFWKGYKTTSTADESYENIQHSEITPDGQYYLAHLRIGTRDFLASVHLAEPYAYHETRLRHLARSISPSHLADPFHTIRFRGLTISPTTHEPTLLLTVLFRPSFSQPTGLLDLAIPLHHPPTSPPSASTFTILRYSPKCHAKLTPTLHGFSVDTTSFLNAHAKIYPRLPSTYPRSEALPFDGVPMHEQGWAFGLANHVSGHSTFVCAKYVRVGNVFVVWDGEGREEMVRGMEEGGVGRRAMYGSVIKMGMAEVGHEKANLYGIGMYAPRGWKDGKWEETGNLGV